jgi:3'-phosphoadenosine 5'-phosphosulfate sulfotransferase (PAPS reductase)/FAD synthetase
MFEPQDLIQQAMERHGENIALACSFGKDSLLVLDMAREIDKHIKVIFENTGVEFPETIKFKDRLKEEWKLNLFETKPLQSFFWCIDHYGLPTTRKQGGKGSNSPKCCQLLKEKPSANLQKELGVNAIITGLQACESRSRDLIAKRYDNKKGLYNEYDNIEFCSQRWYSLSKASWSYNPIMLWQTRDVWKYTLDKQLPINEVYTRWDYTGKIHSNPELKIGRGGFLLLDGQPALYNRCGCLPCTAYISWEKKLPLSHPQLYKMLKVKQHPSQMQLSEVKVADGTPTTNDGIPSKTKVLGILPNEL